MSISGLGKALDQSEILKEYLERSLQLLRKAWQANSSIGTGGVEYVQHAGQISRQYLKLVLRHKFSIQDIAGELERSLRVDINAKAPPSIDWWAPSRRVFPGRGAKSTEN